MDGTELPGNFITALWMIMLAVGGFVSSKVWDWWRNNADDTREFQQKQQLDELAYARQHNQQVLETLKDNAVAMQQVSIAVTNVSAAVGKVMEYLEEMSHREASLQSFLIGLRDDTRRGFAEQKQITSEILAYAMGREPQRATDYTTLLKDLEARNKELEELRLQLKSGAAETITPDSVDAAWPR